VRCLQGQGLGPLVSDHGPSVLPFIPAMADGEDSPEVSTSCDAAMDVRVPAEGVTLGQREGSSWLSGPHLSLPKAGCWLPVCHLHPAGWRGWEWEECCCSSPPPAGGALAWACVGCVTQQVLLAVVHTTTRGAGLTGSIVIHPHSSLHSGCCCWCWKWTNNRVALVAVVVGRGPCSTA
jgi:hypothetical protein